MFRIAKQLVQVSSPAEIPLIALSKQKAPADPPVKPLSEQSADTSKIQALPVAEKISPEIQRAAENLISEAQREAEAKLQAAWEEAIAIQKRAATEAESRLTQAECQAQDILDAAKRQGYEEGQQEGQATYNRQIEEAGQQLSGLLKEIAQARHNLFESFEDDIVELALGIAEKIVVTVIDKDKAAFQAMITNALKHMRREGKISLRVSEQQYQEFFRSDSANFALGDENINVTIVNDPQLKNGDLIVESEEQTVNAGAVSQLKHIMLAFGRPRGDE